MSKTYILIISDELPVGSELLGEHLPPLAV
jgi:hypothetical protein